MSSVEVYMENNHIPEYIKGTKTALETALDTVGMQAASSAATELQNNPSRIDTGLLKNSITWAVGGKSANLSTYNADRESKYTGKMPDPGNYKGTAPSDDEGQVTVYVGTNVEYSLYVHEGTERMAPNRFLKNAVDRYKQEYIEIMADILRNFLT